MSDLVDKLNTLIRAKMNSSLGGLGGSDASDRDDRRPSISDRDIDAQLGALRQQINAALNAEDAMETRLNDVNVQIGALDQQIDAALLDGNDAQARALAQQLQRQQQQSAILAADLDDHRRATSSLIEQVNELEALVSDTRARENQGEPLPPEDVLGVQTPAQSQQPQTTPVSVRIQVNKPTASNPPMSQPPANPPRSPSPPSPTDTDAELARRRARLTGPDNT